jgi:hypothetical protein
MDLTDNLTGDKAKYVKQLDDKRGVIFEEI